MADKIFEMTVTITKTVRVRVPVDDPEIVYPGETPEDVALEFGQGGKSLWPSFVLSEDVDVETDNLKEVAAQAVAA